MIIKNLPDAAMPANKNPLLASRQDDFSATLKDKVSAIATRPHEDHAGKKTAGDKKVSPAGESKPEAGEPQAPTDAAATTSPAPASPDEGEVNRDQEGNAALPTLQPWGVQMTLPAEVTPAGLNDDATPLSAASLTSLERAAANTQPDLPQVTVKAGANKPLAGTDLFQGLSAQKLSEAAGEPVMVNKMPLFPATEKKLSEAASQAAPAVTAAKPDAALPVHEAISPASENVMDVPLTTLTAHHAAAQPAQAMQPATATLNQQLGTPAWQQALGQQLTMFTRNGVQNAELRLHPEELGALQINLRLNNDQAQLHFTTGNHQVRAALEAAVPHLRTLLEESGINLGQTSVGADASSWSSSQSERGFTAKNYQGSHADALPAEEEEREIITKSVNFPQGINTFV